MSTKIGAQESSPGCHYMPQVSFMSVLGTASGRESPPFDGKQEREDDDDLFRRRSRTGLLDESVCEGVAGGGGLEGIKR